MKKCSVCQKEVHDTAKFCPYCGAQVETVTNYVDETVPFTSIPMAEPATLSTLALILSCLAFPLGLILSIVGAVISKDKDNRNRSIIGIILYVVMTIVVVIIFVSLITSGAIDIVNG